ncbi:MAG: saccharopine dehydrogenase NADP-binding domain-containing protein, partial [Desulfobacterales bacterium]|nr:saccharopine dehydrogenase NADP-binding domain-containing protein [Desulfobacterales bacterium]
CEYPWIWVKTLISSTGFPLDIGVDIHARELSMNESKPNDRGDQPSTESRKALMGDTVLLIGGYGLAGRSIAELLLRYSAASILLSGRNRDKGRRTAAELNSRHGGDRVSYVHCDASDGASLLPALKRCDAVVTSLPMGAGASSIVAEAALAVGVHYMDLDVDPDKRSVMQRIDPDVTRKNLLFLCDSGAFPGLPGFLANFAYRLSADLSEVRIGSVMEDDQLPFESARTFINPEAQRPIIFDDEWRTVSLANGRRFDFGGAFGSVKCYPFFLDELEEIPTKKGRLAKLGAYTGTRNKMAALIMVLWPLLGLSRSDKNLDRGGRLLSWTVSRFSRRPFSLVFVMQAVNWDSRTTSVRIEFADAYTGTAIPAVAALFQQLDPARTACGVKFMGHAVEPQRYLEDLRLLGADIEIKKSWNAGTRVSRGRSTRRRI